MIKSLKKGAAPKSFVYGAALLGACGFISKVLGAIFRIPLTNILGAEGMGLYQMVFPLYALLLTVSSGGLPGAVSKLIAEKLARGDRQGASKIFTAAMFSLALIGIVLGVIVAAMFRVIARLQGNDAAAWGYLAIAPSIFFVAVISAFRGYFQGKQNMAPSAISQLIEQGIKMAVGLTLAYIWLKKGLEYGVLGAIVGVSLSELGAMVVMLIQYLFDKEKLPLKLPKSEAKEALSNLYKIAIPITLGSAIIPFIHLIDSVLVINILSKKVPTHIATALYGVFSGPVHSLVNMPVVLSLAMTVAIIPSISASNAKGDKEKVRQKAMCSLKLTMLIALPCTIGLIVLAKPVIMLLYSGGLKTGEIDEPNIAAALMMILAISIVFVALLQLSSGILQAVDKPVLPVINLSIGAGIKLALSVILLKTMGIYGAAVSTIICYLVSMILNVWSVKKHLGVSFDFMRLIIRPMLASGIMGLAAYLVNDMLSRLIHEKIAVLCAIAFAAAMYFVIIMLLDIFDEEEKKMIPILQRLLPKNQQAAAD